MGTTFLPDDIKKLRKKTRDVHEGLEDIIEERREIEHFENKLKKKKLPFL